MDIEEHMDRISRAADKLSAACSAAADACAPKRAAARRPTPTSRPKTPVLRMMEVTNNLWLCNGFLGGGPGQVRRMFVERLRQERVGLVITACHWDSAQNVAAVVEEAGARHILVEKTADAISQWVDLRDAIEAALQVAQTQRVVINCFEYSPVGAMLAVAMMVYSNTLIEAAVTAVLPFEASIATVSKPKRAPTEFQQMLAAMENLRKTNPWTPPEPVPPPRKRGRPRLDPAPVIDVSSTRRTRSMDHPDQRATRRRRLCGRPREPDTA